MRGFLLGLSVSIAFIAGFALAHLTPVARAADLDIPKLQMPGPKWEYICYRAELTLDLLEVANKAGSEGWEMVGTDGQGPRSPIWCFKRIKKPLVK